VVQDLNPDKAGGWIQALRERAVIQQDLRALAEVSYNMAGLRRDAGDGRGAIAHGQEALDLYRKIGDAKFECWSLWALAHSFLRLGELQKAEMYALQALETAQRIESQFSLGLVHARLGEIYSALSFLDKAEHALQTALQLWREIGNLPRVLWLLVRLGQLYLAMAKLERAFESFKEAIALAGTDGLRQDPLLHASILSGLEDAFGEPEAFRAFCQRFREEWDFRPGIWRRRKPGISLGG